MIFEINAFSNFFHCDFYFFLSLFFYKKNFIKFFYCCFSKTRFNCLFTINLF